MTSYLLLRNNKESGPFSLEELVSKGLKAYDLVWIKGKSAAWRYPGEISELMEFAPPVEEQPYDRFYKKSTDTVKKEEVAVKKQEPVYREPVAIREEAVIAQAQPTVQKEHRTEEHRTEEHRTEEHRTEEHRTEEHRTVRTEEQGTEELRTVKTEEPKTYQPQPAAQKETVAVQKKSVFVTLPKQQPRPDFVKEESQPTSSSPYEKYQPAAQIISKDPQEPAQPAKTITITENPVAAEIKYSQPLDEIKEMYVKTLQDRKQRMANKAFLLQTMKKVAVVLAIVGAGILIGFAIKSNAVKKMVASAGTIPQQQITQPQTTTAVTDSQQDELAQEQEQPQQQSQQEQGSYEEPSQQRTSDPAPAVPRTSEKQNLAKQNSEPPLIVTETPKEIEQPKQRDVAINEPSPGVDINERTGERSRKLREANGETDEPANDQPAEIVAEPKKDPVKAPKAVMNTKGLAKLVSVKTNAYKIVAFGGIRDLHLTVYNDSKYLLDKVLVELEYLKPSEEPFRMDMIQFKSVSPGGSLTIRMPDTNRGIKVRYRIVQILSTQSAKDMADL